MDNSAPLQGDSGAARALAVPAALRSLPADFVFQRRHHPLSPVPI